MAKIISILLVLTGVATVATAQTLDEDPAITSLMRSYVQHNELHQEVRGWRVQILVTTDRRQMESVRSDFEEAFPDNVVHYDHENPYYHLKTGAFLTQADARPYLNSIREVFKTAFIVADDIDVAEVIKYQ